MEILMRLFLIALTAMSVGIALVACAPQDAERDVVELPEDERAELRELRSQLDEHKAEMDKTSKRMAGILSSRLQIPISPGVIVCDPVDPVCWDIISGCVTITYSDGTKVSYQDPPGVSCEGGCPCD